MKSVIGKLRGLGAASFGAAAVVSVFVASRLYYSKLGVSFEIGTLHYDHLLDLELLTDRLLLSLFELHSQPPLYNLLTGVALKLSASRPEFVLEPLFLGCGLWIGLCSYWLLLALSLRVRAATFVACAIVAAPALVAYENWYFYPHLAQAGLIGGVAFLARSGGRPGRALWVSALHFAALSLTWSLFHPLFFASVAGIAIAFAVRSERWRVFKCFAAPGLLVLALCLKNLALFGFFGTSSWAAQNLYKNVTNVLGAERVAFEARRGAVWDVEPFLSPEHALREFQLDPARSGSPALDRTTKLRPLGANNLNHRVYPAVAKFYSASARRLIAAFPRAYLEETRRLTVPLFFDSVTSYRDLRSNRRALGGLADAFDALDASIEVQACLAVGVLSWFLLAFREQRLLACVALAGLSWVSSAGLFGEFGENYRFRYQILFLVWILSAAGYAALGRAVERRWSVEPSDARESERSAAAERRPEECA